MDTLVITILSNQLHLLSVRIRFEPLRAILHHQIYVLYSVPILHKGVINKYLEGKNTYRVASPKDRATRCASQHNSASNSYLCFSSNRIYVNSLLLIYVYHVG
jgi:hypothetical protein